MKWLFVLITFLCSVAQSSLAEVKPQKTRPLKGGYEATAKVTEVKGKVRVIDKVSFRLVKKDEELSYGNILVPFKKRAQVTVQYHGIDSTIKFPTKVRIGKQGIERFNAPILPIIAAIAGGGETENQKLPENEAIGWVEELIKENPKDASLHELLGQMYVEEGNSRALKNWKTKKEKDIVFTAIDGGGKEYYNKAIEAFRNAIRIEPKNTTYKNHLGATYLIMGEEEEALSQFSEILKSDNPNPIAHYGLSLAYYQKGKFLEAMKEIIQAIHLAGEFEQFYKAYKLTLIGLKEQLIPDKLFNSVLEILRKGTNSKSKNIQFQAHMCLGVTYQHRGDYYKEVSRSDKAEEQYLKAIEEYENASKVPSIGKKCKDEAKNAVKWVRYLLSR